MSSERIEWVEIIEPRTKEHMYANLTTGECVWDPPEGVNIKRTNDSQWWELFDTNTHRFYYYNVASQTTVWHRPVDCDIIPLAKLQTLKQNTERKDESTQTSHGKISKLFRNEPRVDIKAASSKERGPQESRSVELLASPQGRHSFRPSSTDSPGGRHDTHKYCRHTGGSTSPRNNSQRHDSGKSSDSSLSSAHGYRRLQDGGSLRIGQQQQHGGRRKQHSAENCYRMLQESNSSHNIPHVAMGGGDTKPSSQYPKQKMPYSLSNSSDLAGSASPAHSTSTPQLKKKLTGDFARTSTEATKHQSFDFAGKEDPPIVSLTRSGSFMSSPRQQHQSRTVTTPGNEGNGGGSDDSMHEKYFKSVENTPVTRRRHTTSAKGAAIASGSSGGGGSGGNDARASGSGTSSKMVAASGGTGGSSDSSPQSPISPQNHATKPARPSLLSSVSIAIDTPSSYISSHKNDPELLNLDLPTKPERYLDKMKLDKGKVSPGSVSNSSGLSIQQINNLMKPLANKYSGGVTSSQCQTSLRQQHASSFSNTPKEHKEETSPAVIPYLSKPNLERHNKEMQQQKHSTERATSTGRRTRRRQQYMMGTMTSDAEYDNGNISPLYSNWDQEMQEHLLPLQHYIIEQAKLSGCYRLGDPLDSDSLHSDSQSEHSFSGHEPDNEDSDHSDGRGDYLTHHCVTGEDYGMSRGGGGGAGHTSYYNIGLNFDKEKEDISSEVEAKLESARDEPQIYSPVRNHPIFPLGGGSGMPHHHHHGKMAGMQKQQSMPSAGFHHQQSIDRHVALHGLSKVLPPSGPGGAPQLAIMKECDIEKFAQDNLNLHSKGIFRKKSSVRDMLSWTGNAISRPMLAVSRDKAGKKMATELFKLVQIYMGDRKARQGMSLNSVVIDIISLAVQQPPLRDELYVQLCRQTTENPSRESLIRGWELMAICLSFLPPSPTFQPALLNYMNRHRDPTFATSFPEVGKWPIHVQISHYATIACRRLDRIGSSGKKQAKKPSEDEVNQARDQIFRDSMFGNTLQEVMELQKERFPDRQLPWVQVTLSEQVLLMGGKQTEGIFRVPADVDEVMYLKNRLDRWEIPEYKPSMDAHSPASLLKLWYRELYDPLIPDELYEKCVQTEDPEEAATIVNKLPRINRMVLTYLIHFLQQFAQPDVVANTKMDSSNLAMVFAPNCLRCTSQDPKVILENARKEMAFLRTLIINMDTSSVAYLK
ncbi:rho GTPase-activating protein 39 isoform X2 [Phlebotomus papatasi]|uniref:rho GTPase-activating protein 39 isoform X2 n=1 Tax=Phlebotomus papatasi TaxID=29031 RepID=UPI0024841EFA|nr:rho GTPase-activating protein 39 isoform X2 [Phlebotomus papatasi]